MKRSIPPGRENSDSSLTAHEKNAKTKQKTRQCRGSACGTKSEPTHPASTQKTKKQKGCARMKEARGKSRERKKGRGKIKHKGKVT